MKTTLVLALAAALTLLAADAGAEKEAAAKYALLVGCSEYPVLEKELGTEKYRASVRLLGPENDVAAFADVLTSVLGFDPENITKLVGWDPENESSRPTKANILARLERLAKTAKRGDQVVILMAGHGSQQPDTDGDERDGLDEIFLPADTGGWKLEAGEVENSIRDDQIFGLLKAIRDGADGKGGVKVWIIFDTCHSGTMTRGLQSDVRDRRLDPTLLGVPRPPLSRGGSGPEMVEDAEAEGLVPNIVALSGAQSYRSAPEMPLPRNETGAEYHGLLSFLLTKQLRRRGGDITIEELHNQLLAAYQALPWYGTMPQVEGDVRMTASGGRGDGGPLLLARLDGEVLELNAGTLADMVPGTVLRLYRPGGLGQEAEVLGRAKVASAGPTESTLELLANAEGAVPELGGEAYPAEVTERPCGDTRLKVACCDSGGVPLKAVPDAVAEEIEKYGSTWKYPFVSTVEEADWLLVADGGKYSLRPAQNGGDELLDRLEVKLRDLGDLEPTLARLFRFENLKRLAGSWGVSGIDPDLAVRVLRAPASPTRPAEDDPAWAPLENGGDLRVGEWLKITARNGTRRSYDLWIFFLDGSFGITALFPGKGETPRLSHQDTKEITVGIWPVQADTMGQEHLLILAMPVGEEDPPTELRWLEQTCSDVSRKGVNPRGAGAGGAFGDLLEELSTGNSRGLGSSTGPEAAVGLFTWKMAWPEPTPVLDEPVPVFDDRNVLEQSPEPEGGDLAPNPARPRGSLVEIYAKLAPSVFVVRSRTGHGTGLLIDEKKGLVLTNHHVIDSGFSYDRRGGRTLTLVRGELNADGVMEVRQDDVTAVVVYADERADLALLKITSSAPWLEKLEPVPLAAKAPRTGQECSVVGHPASGMLWTIRPGNVAGIGKSPQDISDYIVQRLGVGSRERRFAEEQLAKMASVKIVLSSCQANPGDSGGPLVDKDGALLGVTHAIPIEERTDKFIYHIHVDEVRAFLAACPDPDEPIRPKAPDAWRLGPRVNLKRTMMRRPPDILEAGADQPQQIFIDLDEDTRFTTLDEEGLRKLIETRSFDAELAFHALGDRRIAFYDTDNRDGFDLILVDYDEDEEADVRFTRSGEGWKVEVDVSVTWLDPGYLKDKHLRDVAARKLRVLR